LWKFDPADEFSAVVVKLDENRGNTNMEQEVTEVTEILSVSLFSLFPPV
jgi:hypothetical protein